MNFIRQSGLAALRAATLVFGLSVGLQSGVAWAVSITTVAGSGDSSIYGEGVPATAAGMKGPHGVAFDSVGNLYIADRNRFRVRKVDALTGIITTVAGDGNFGITGDGGPATSATLRTPEALAVDANNNLYIADSSGNLVRKVNLATGIITLVAGSYVPPTQLGDGGPAAAARLNAPNGVAVDPAGNVYISDWGNNRIRKVNASTQVISTVAGTGLTAFGGDGGLATQATIHAPNGVFLDGNNNLYIVDTGNSRIRKVSGAGVISTVAGDGGRAFAGDGGPATSASLFDPMGVAVDRDGTIYIGDTGNDRIRRVSNGVITTYAGTGAPGFGGDGGDALAASFLSPRGVGVDPSGNVYVADFGNDRVRKIAAFTAQTITFPPIASAVRLPGETLVVTATASSGLAVTFTSLTLPVCTVASTTVTFVTAGACVIAADQPGDGTFGAAPRVTQSIPVGVPGSIPQSITFTPLAVRTYLPGDGVTLDATATSGLAVAFSSSTGSICTVAGNKATLLAPGTCTIAADQAGDATYVAAPRVTQSLLVSTPGSFAFIDQANVLTGRFITSNTVQITGIAAPVAVTVTGGSYSIGCSGAFSTAPGTIAPGQTICVRHASSVNPNTTTDTVLTVGVASDTFSSTTASSNAAGLIAGYYRSILRREADIGGLSYWEGEAARMYGLGANVNETWRAMSIAFFGGAEYRAFNRTDTEFVVDLYNTFFNRPPELDGLAYWTGQITSGIPPRVVILSFLFSGEFTNYMQSIFGAVPSRPEEDMVIDFYRGFLDRLPDSAGFVSWVTRFRAAQCTSRQAVQLEADAISRDFLNSPEYLARSRSNLDYVSDLYNAFMRRGADLAGVSYWDNQLNTSAQTREQLRQVFLSSPEFQERLKRVADRGCT